MINSIFPVIIQAAAQAVNESPVAGPFESAALWIDDALIAAVIGIL